MKRILVFLCTFSLCLSALFSPCAFAESVSSDLDGYSINTNSPISTLTEQKEWILRVYNGYRQKRLWSITYNKWLTDWITIGPAT